MKSVIHSAVVLSSILLSVNAGLVAYMKNMYEEASDFVTREVPEAAQEPIETVQCGYHMISDFFLRDIPALTQQETSQMFSKVIEITGSDTRKHRFLNNETDFSSKELVYKHALLVGYSYCRTEEEIPTQGILPDIVNGTLPTGKFNIFRDPTHEKPEYQVTVNHEEKTIVLAWRGSLTLQDYIYDSNGFLRNEDDSSFSKLKSYGTSSATCSLSTEAQGFEGFLLSLPDEIQELASLLAGIKKLGPDYSFVVVGHSLGGAKALLFSYYVSNFLSKELPITAVYTFGQPIIGNKAFSNDIAECIGKEKIIRVVSERDTVVFARRQKDEIDHPDDVTVVYGANHSEFHYEKCSGPNDPKCGCDTECPDLTATYHSWFAGLYFNAKEMLRSSPRE